QLQIDDLSGYRQTCDRMLQRFGSSDDPATADAIALTCALAPRAIADPSRPITMIENGFKRTNGHYGYGGTVYGAALYRADRLDQAARELKRYRSGLSRLFLAMAEYHLGRVDDARRGLAEATRLIEQDEARTISG